MNDDADRNPHGYNDDAPGDAGPGDPGYDGRVEISSMGAALPLGDDVDARHDDDGEPPAA